MEGMSLRVHGSRSPDFRACEFFRQNLVVQAVNVVLHNQDKIPAHVLYAMESTALVIGRALHTLGNHPFVRASVGMDVERALAVFDGAVQSDGFIFVFAFLLAAAEQSRG